MNENITISSDESLEKIIDKLDDSSNMYISIGDGEKFYLDNITILILKNYYLNMYYSRHRERD